MLDGSSIALCLDTGHLLIGGTDPAELTRQAPDRIAHVHFKDVDAAQGQARPGRPLDLHRGRHPRHVPAAGHRGRRRRRDRGAPDQARLRRLVHPRAGHHPRGRADGRGPGHATSGPARTTCAPCCGARGDGTSPSEPLRVGILGAARIAELAIVKPAHATGTRLVTVAARDRHRAEAFAAAARRRAGDRLLRRGAGRPRGRGRLQPAAERAARPVEPRRRRGGQARALGEAVRLHRGGGRGGPRRRAEGRRHGGRGLPLPVPPGDAAAVRAPRRRRAGRAPARRRADRDAASRTTATRAGRSTSPAAR